MYTDPRPTTDPPVAPTQEAWDAMTPAERRRAVEALPTYMVDASPPEGEFHGEACDIARDTLREFFRTRSPGVHVGSDLPVYYPGEPQFCPDMFVVFDVEPGKRNRWVVSEEGHGLDFVLEVVYRGSRQKDFVENLARYARLGIPEYFIFDLERGRLSGHRLPEGGGARYVPVVPQYGRHPSRVLGMDLVVEADGLQFYNNNARLLSPPELALRLKETLTAVEQRLTEELRAREEAERAQEAAKVAEEAARQAEETARQAEEAARQAAEEEAKRAEDAERRLAEALAELARLKGR